MNLRLDGSGGAHQARFHDPAHRADDELPAQRPAPGGALTVSGRQSGVDSRSRQSESTVDSRQSQSPFSQATVPGDRRTSLPLQRMSSRSAAMRRKTPAGRALLTTAAIRYRHAIVPPFHSRTARRSHPCHARRDVVRFEAPGQRRGTGRVEFGLARRLSRAGRTADRRIDGVAVCVGASGLDGRHLRQPAERLESSRRHHRLGGGGDEEGRPRERPPRAGQGAALGARSGERGDRRPQPARRS